MNKGIRQLIQEQVSADAQIAGMLAAYNGKPAFFYQKAPSDSRAGWGEPRYPRADFNLDTRHDPERRAEGTLTVNIWCTTECPAVGDLDPDRVIEQRLLELISGTFYTGGDRETICAEWERSDEFISEETTSPEAYGLTMTFVLMAFPLQITTDPDPIQGLNIWTKRHFPDMTAIAYDGMPPIWKPTDGNPAIYWRFAGTSATDIQSYAATWYTGAFAAHIIAKSVPERNKWTKALMERAQIDGEIILPDTSPMFIKGIAARNSADPLREGQMELTGRYGVLAQHRKETAQPRLTNPHRNPANQGGIDDMEASYKASELAAQAGRLFGTTPEVAGAALRDAGKETATIEEARAIVRAFLEREVK